MDDTTPALPTADIVEELSRIIRSDSGKAMAAVLIQAAYNRGLSDGKMSAIKTLGLSRREEGA